MAGINLQNFLKQLGTGDTIHDYQHAARIFTDSTLRRSPKYAFLFYVKFTLNYGADDSMDKFMRLKRTDVLDIGALAKSASLPKFTIDNKVFNAYNRPNIVQSKLKYDPVTIKFHDDSISLVREFWYDYLTYYYRDTDYSDAVYDTEHKYAPRQRDQWGYSLKPDVASPGTSYSSPNKVNMLSSISIFSMSQKQFHEYKLINPIITQFQHGDHNMAETNGTMEHTMQVMYETVHYRKGNVTNETMSEMLLHYDKSPSPLSPAGGGTRSVFGPGGLFNSLDDLSTNLGSGNFLGAALIAARAKQTFKGVDIGKVAVAEGTELLTSAVRTGQNPFSSVSAPSSADALAYAGLIGVASAIGQTNSSTTASGIPSTQTLVGQTNASGVTVAGASAVRDEAIAPTSTAVVSNGVTITAASTPAGTTVPAFPSIVVADNGTSNISAFVVPATGDPLPKINNSNEVVSTTQQGTPV